MRAYDNDYKGIPQFIRELIIYPTFLYIIEIIISFFDHFSKKKEVAKKKKVRFIKKLSNKTKRMI